MKINYVYLCPECDEVFEFRRKGLTGVKNLSLFGQNYAQCPACTNRNVLNLGRIVNGQVVLFGRKERKRGVYEIYTNSGSDDTHHFSNGSIGREGICCGP